MLESRTGIALNLIAPSAHEMSYDLNSSKLILLSDLHRGIGDEADDFFACRYSYQAALKHYEQTGFTLGLLGDVEELWENGIEEVLQYYKPEIELEQAFHDKKRLIRIFGNHDELWRVEFERDRHLRPIFPMLEVHELVKLRVMDRGQEVGAIYLTHGHQGSISSDALAEISRFFVRVFWRRIQTWFNIKLTQPSNNLRLRSKLDRALHRWAAKRDNTLIICGHTHQPVFMSRTHIDQLELDIRHLLSSGKLPSHDEIVTKRSKIMELRKQQTELTVGDRDLKPSYFNTGCCSFSDGQITGIELEKDAIRLIKWQSEGKRTVLAERSLRYVLSQKK